MTIDEFLERLSQTPREWQVTPDGLIRTRGISDCPLEAVLGNLSRMRESFAIIRAADNHPRHDPVL
jgi:hypothetical protein